MLTNSLENASENVPFHIVPMTKITHVFFHAHIFTFIMLQEINAQNALYNVWYVLLLHRVLHVPQGITYSMECVILVVNHQMVS